MRFAYENLIEDAGLSADSEYSVDTFRAKNILDRQTGKRWRSFRSPNLMLYGNCDNANAPTIDGPAAAAVNGTWLLDENMKYEGTGSWCLTKSTLPGGGNANCNLQDTTDTTDMHGLSAGVPYVFRVRMRTNAATPANVSFILLNYVGAAWITIATGVCVAADTWEFKTDYACIDSTATGIRIRAIILTGENIGVKLWIDDIKVYVANDYIQYGKCESTTSPSLDGTVVGCTNGTWARSAAKQYAGSYSWLLTKTTAGGGGSAAQDLQDNVLTNDMHGLIAGSTYRASVALQTDAATPANASFILLEHYAAAWNATTIGACSAAGVWELKEKTITLNPATTGIRIYPRIDTSENAGKLLYIDMLSIKLEPRLTIDLYSAAAPQYAAIIGHNLSSSAVVKVEANTSASWTTPAVSETMTLAYLMLHTMTNAVAYRYWSFVFSDYDYNEDGYIEIGYGAIGDYFQPTNGAARVFQETPDDMSAVNTTITGEVMGSIAGLMDGWEINIPTMNTATKTLFEAMYAEVRNHTPFIFVLDQSLTAYFPVKYVYFVGNSPYKFTHIMTLDQWACSFTIKECI